MITPEDPKTAAIDDEKLDDVSGGIFMLFAQCDAAETSPNEEAEGTLGQSILPPIK